MQTCHKIIVYFPQGGSMLVCEDTIARYKALYGQPLWTYTITENTCRAHTDERTTTEEGKENDS